MSIKDITFRKWNPSVIYDVSDKEKDLRLRRAQLRIENSKQYIKLSSDPYGNIGNMNPAMNRYSSMEVHTHLFYRSSPKSILFNFCIMIPPVLLFSYYTYIKTRFEKRLRTGQVKYSERNNKYII
ncbi:hypothetical protein A3Q56_00784 [Intoshia linei]|uniref:NADH dehydrogenase [ubiquinone] 1 beta subcomplex subunit 4 n=1 Tax=Intoshia linei TaxID=1819745 RepID=A0A177BAU0_9BILA|nr:hypothetical protein A3Q56_00784 [Intoshia linei]